MVGTPTEPPGETEPPIFEILEAVQYASVHDNTVVLIRDGQVAIDRGAS